MSSTLILGSKGPAVVTLQHELNRLSSTAKPLSEDSDFGPKTDLAVRTFQLHEGLEVDGKVGPLTEAAIQNALQGLSAGDPPVKPKPPLYPRMQLDVDKMLTLFRAQQAAKVTYGFGSKDPTPKTTLPIDYKQIDCSGEVRELIYHGTDGAILMPDGSQVQLEWLISKGYERCSFEATGTADNRMRVGVYTNPSGGANHIWLVHMFETLESHGGVGPSRRAWNCAAMRSIAGHSTFFVLS